MGRFIDVICQLLSGLSNCQKDLPAFTWDEDEVSGFGIPLLKITFPKGEVDFAELQQTTKDHCIFTGFLRNEPTSYVALSGGCPFEDTFEVSPPLPLMSKIGY